MAHPRTYSDDDPYLTALRPVCLALPEAREVEAWGRPTFRAGSGKMFAVYEREEDRPFVLAFKPEAEERPALLQDERFFVPRYHGAHGWLGLDLSAADVDWQEVAELVESSYRLVANRRQLRALDGQVAPSESARDERQHPRGAARPTDDG